MKLAVVVVAYHAQPDAVLENIKTYGDYADPLILWDNTERCDNDWSSLRKVYPEVIVCQYGENIGLASAYNAAAKLASQRGCTHLMTMDQDSAFVNVDEYIKQIPPPKQRIWNNWCIRQPERLPVAKSAYYRPHLPVRQHLFASYARRYRWFSRRFLYRYGRRRNMPQSIGQRLPGDGSWTMHNSSPHRLGAQRFYIRAQHARIRLQRFAPLLRHTQPNYHVARVPRRLWLEVQDKILCQQAQSHCKDTAVRRRQTKQSFGHTARTVPRCHEPASTI